MRSWRLFSTLSILAVLLVLGCDKKMGPMVEPPPELVPVEAVHAPPVIGEMTAFEDVASTPDVTPEVDPEVIPEVDPDALANVQMHVQVVAQGIAVETTSAQVSSFGVRAQEVREVLAKKKAGMTPKEYRKWKASRARLLEDFDRAKVQPENP